MGTQSFELDWAVLLRHTGPDYKMVLDYIWEGPVCAGGRSCAAGPNLAFRK